MNKKTVFMFSGQGSQYYQMGKELYENNTQFKFWMDECNRIVTPLIDISLIDLLYNTEKKSTPFDRLLYSNPALLSVEYSLYKVLQELDIHPDIVMGYSLGEITAAIVANVISLEEGIEIAVSAAKFTEEKTPAANMLAIMASKMVVMDYPDLFSDCDIIGTNFQENFVVCGLPHHTDNILNRLNDEGINSLVLPVNFGFHTKMIDPIKDDFKKLVKNINPKSASIEVVSSYTTEQVVDFNEDYLWEVIRYPINFENAIHNLKSKGDYNFIDVGPSGTLAMFVKYILPSDSGSVALPTINQFGNDLNSINKLKEQILCEAY